MKSKTLNLIKHYHKILEQAAGDMGGMPPMGGTPPAPTGGDATDIADTGTVDEPTQSDVKKLTSQGELAYIDLILQALAKEPSAEDKLKVDELRNMLEDEGRNVDAKKMIENIKILLTNSDASTIDAINEYPIEEF